MIDRHVERVIVNPQSIDIQLLVAGAVEATEENTSAAVSQMHDGREQAEPAPATVISVPW